MEENRNTSQFRRSTEQHNEQHKKGSLRVPYSIKTLKQEREKYLRTLAKFKDHGQQMLQAKARIDRIDGPCKNLTAENCHVNEFLTLHVRIQE